MKNFILLVLLGIFPIVLSAQKKAVTENGDEVILYDDGTWKYSGEEKPEEEKIPTNPNAFTKNGNSTFLLKSNKFHVGVWLNTKKWKFEKAENNEAAEYEFKYKANDLYGMIITEKIPVPLTTLKDIALDNARKVAPDIKVTKTEYRKVNGLDVLMMEMSGTLKGIKITYIGYYFTDDNGTLQFLTYSSQSLMPSLKSESEELLNGLVKVE